MSRCHAHYQGLGIFIFKGHDSACNRSIYERIHRNVHRIIYGEYFTADVCILVKHRGCDRYLHQNTRSGTYIIDGVQ